MSPAAVAAHTLEGAALAALRAAAILKRMPHGAINGAEVGVFTGRMSRVLLTYEPLSLLMVDSWEGGGAAYAEVGRDWHAQRDQAEQDKFMAAALRNTDFANGRRKVMRKRSVDAADEIEDLSLDFVFLDADHSYEGCLADLTAWWPKVRAGGYLCGHDYANPAVGDVRTAVEEFALRVELDCDFTWFARKC